MIIEYPKMENAEEIFTDLWRSSALKKYGDVAFGDLVYNIHRDLSAIEKQGAASGYIIVKHALEAVRAKHYEFYFKGTLSGSVIAYLLGFSYYDPLSVEPRVYSDFVYGYDGSKPPGFEMTVTKGLYDRLIDYFDNFSSELPVEYRYDQYGKVTGVYFGESGGRDSAGKWKAESFCLSIIAVDDIDKFRERMLTGDVFEICHPESLAEYVKCIGFKYSAGTWEGNAKDLLLLGQASFDELIANREDVFELLLEHGIDRRVAFEMTEDVRLGKVYRNGWDPQKLAVIKKAGLQDWFIESCKKTKYLWTRTHTIAMMNWLGGYLL